MYLTLKTEMARKKITGKEIAEKTGKNEGVISRKINGYTSFSVEEAILIRDLFFPELSVEDIFRKESN